MPRNLQIRKLSDKVWKHIDSITGAYILTKFYAKEDDSKFLIVEVYGSRRYEYAIEDISVYNIGGSAETFTNFDDLFLRLEVLKYPAFYVDGEFVFNPSAYDLSEFQNTETDRFAKLSDITGGGATTFLDLTDTPSAYTGQANKIVKVNAGETALQFTDEGGSSVNIQTTITGTPTVGTTETISQSILIPANTISLGVYDLLARSFKNNTLGNATNKLYINTSVTLVGALQLGIGTTSGAGRRTNPLQRFLNVKVLDGTGRGTVVQNLSDVVNAYNYDSVAPSDLAINWTIDQYIIHTVQNTNGTETSVSEYIKIRE